MKAVVTGAAGFVGSFLCEHLTSQGHDVVATVRSSSDLRWIRGLDVALATCDVCSPDSLSETVDGAEVVYHAAGLVRADSRRDFTKVNFEGTKNVVHACLRARRPPRRLVFVSSQAAAGPSSGPEGIDEDSPPRPVSAYGESKLAAERYLSGVGGVETVIVRPAAVYGPRDVETVKFFQIVSRLRLRPLLNEGRTMLSMIEVRDLVKGIGLAGEASGAAGRTYFLANSRPQTIAEVMNGISAGLGRRTVAVPVNRLLLSAGAEISQFLAQFRRGGADLSHLKVAELAQKYWVVKTEKARKELGFETSTPIETGLSSAARWYIENKWL